MAVSKTTGDPHRFSQPSPYRYDRHITTFVREADGRYRRDDEHHRTVLLDTSTVPALLSQHGVTATVGDSFHDDDRPLPNGLKSIIGASIPRSAMTNRWPADAIIRTQPARQYSDAPRPGRGTDAIRVRPQCGTSRTSLTPA